MANSNNNVHLLTIPGRLPGANEWIDAERASRHKAAKMKAEVQARITLYIRKDLRGVKFTRPVMMAYTWVEKDRRRDKDNIAFARKFIQDALVNAGTLKDDGWNYVADFSDEFKVEKNKARVEVRIWESD